MSGWTHWNGRQAAEAARAALLRGLLLAGEVVLEQAQQEVPLDEGTLKSSGTVVPEPSGLPIVAISFGGGAGTGFPVVPYAVRWHENSARFQRGRKHRYLADPLNQKGPQALERSLRHELAAEFGGGRVLT